MSMIMLLAALWVLPGCGGDKPVDMAEIPTYPQARVLGADESAVDDTLAKKIEQDAIMRKMMSTVSAGAALEQKNYELPQNANWDGVLDFYEAEIIQAGWQNASGVTRKVANLSPIFSSGGPATDPFQSMLYVKGKQLLALVMVTLPADEDNPEEYKELIVSLVTGKE